MKATRTYYFFICNESVTAPEQIVATIKCKSPRRTKAYRTLQALFNENKIQGFGYKINQHQVGTLNLN